ncbi:TRAM domain-containing protein [Halorussus gelatinilyticus]|uniref:TRAM domain-containing protein n=1 Tax=Halorussus gelatinilyticus TaxID=2937524 RepID=A0A8U0IPI9_9EURY|nr:TRAM domain-containing protein [Halorussus gelatinilyticus]UPW01929.1 TRAM domain-containing protein [Halorussus gelatinilyticus]
MPDCPLAEECPSFQERIEGMGCQHYGDRGGAEWCQHYSQPISELKTAPVQPGEEVVVDVEDIHESGAGVGRTDDGFIVMVDGVLPEARAKVRVTNVHGNHAEGEEVERLPMDDEETDETDAESDADSETDDGDADDGDDRSNRTRLGSRDNFWGS